MEVDVLDRDGVTKLLGLLDDAFLPDGCTVLEGARMLVSDAADSLRVCAGDE
ncbi:hypothetical protein [Kitasatospora sp. HPMI-4]|uniref:hypothetical protein n=1 Tax=Kitasatospora sp. HPMI-4 TaxID=3448443 RepID=UPI003F1AB002